MKILDLSDQAINPIGSNNFSLGTDILIKSGNYFDFLIPHENIYDITDIAHGLSNICRFGGHTNQFYSVAQHSVHASYLVPAEYRFDALMHDAAESFIGDIPKPLKELLPDYKIIEKRVEKAIFDKFGIQFPLPECVKYADLVLLATEQRDLMPAHDDEWAMIRGIKPLVDLIVPVSQPEAFAMFLERFQELKKQ